VRPVRRRFPDILLQVDANSAYTLADAPIFRRMDDLDLLLIEQPLEPDDIVDHAMLQRELCTPICLDESIHAPADARHALDLVSCRIINIKPGRVGAIAEVERSTTCAEREIFPCGVGMLETNIGRAHNVALASLPGFTLPGDISASARYYAHDIATPSFDLNGDSTLSVSTSPGIGVEIDRDALSAVTVSREVLDGAAVLASLGNPAGERVPGHPPGNDCPPHRRCRRGGIWDLYSTYPIRCNGGGESRSAVSHGQRL
jgi:O-succinylbenzoate synthase